MAAPVARHEIRALLRAHLAAASGGGHLTRHCAVCHRLLRLAMGPAGAAAPPRRVQELVSAASGAPEEAGDESPPNE